MVGEGREETRVNKESRLHGKAVEPARCMTASMVLPLTRALPPVMMPVVAMVAMVPVMAIVSVVTVMRVLDEACLPAVDTDLAHRH